MPQMMPLSWLSLYLFFSSILMLFTFMNYYTYIPLPQSSKTSMKKIKTVNWKW
uniref:ATP synthase F0 subunit 8 n=1 Tax=Symplocodes ridleyi TaxID=2163934 RepID=UPI00279810AC|nr:ATP synthase F0 subunit 8 [Symplocodes ridleyi]WGO57733.1 ATP synthase F0 subunit 8 [Symplocodes ridleyi]